jgi:hypothetical protein
LALILVHCIEFSYMYLTRILDGCSPTIFGLVTPTTLGLTHVSLTGMKKQT